MSSAAASDQRSRIQQVALDLMGRNGVAGTSMRRLAEACGLNVATLYHYFPSKAELVRSLLAERRYRERLMEEHPSVPPDLAPRERYLALVRLLLAGAAEEASLWRVLIGESVHGDETVRDAINEVFATLVDGLRAWIAELFPDLPDEGPRSTAAVARLTEALVISTVVQALALGTTDPMAAAAHIADLLFEEPGL